MASRNKKNLSTIMRSVDSLDKVDFDSISWGKPISFDATKSHQDVKKIVDKLRNIADRLEGAEQNYARNNYQHQDLEKLVKAAGYDEDVLRGAFDKAMAFVQNRMHESNQIDGQNKNFGN